MKKLITKYFSREKYNIGLVLLILAALFVYLALVSGGVYGGADTYLHYSISHYAFHHPYLFVDHWGKPLFTALSAPFSQLGFFGLQVFNIILSLSSAYLAYLICKQLKFKYAWLSILLVLFAPVYFILVFTGLTETLFGFVLILGVYLFFKEKYWLTAIVISFLPFARTEGFIIMPLFAIALAYRKKWAFLPLLLSGLLLYSISGYFHYKDIFWFFTKNPYTGAQDIYGKGSLWHFVVSYREIFGLGFTALILAGIVAFLIPFFSKQGKTERPVIALLLIMLPAGIYFTAHSYLWWKGLNGSLGLIRVIAGIIPLAAIIGVKGLNLFAPRTNKRKAPFLILGAMLFGFIVYEPFGLYTLPFPNGPEEKVLDEAANWMKKEKLDRQKVYSGNAYLFFKLGLDLYEKKEVFINFPDRDHLTCDTKPGEVFVWDSHFGPNEGRLDLETLLDNKYFELKALFLPDPGFITMGGRPYEVYVFQRVVDTLHASNATILEDLRQNYFLKQLIYLNTFSTTNVFVDSLKNNSCFRIKNDIEFSPGLDSLLKQCNPANSKQFEICVDVFPTEKCKNSAIDLVASLLAGPEALAYITFIVDFKTLQTNQWNTLQYKFALPETTNAKAALKVYFWNNKKAEVFIDNLKVSAIERNRN